MQHAGIFVEWQSATAFPNECLLRLSAAGEQAMKSKSHVAAAEQKPG